MKMPRLKGIPFEAAIIERYHRRESSVEEALIEMYLAGVSVRRVEDITEALWGTRVSPATVSGLNKKAYVHGEIGLCRAENPRMSMWTASICAGIGVANLRTQAYSWPWALMKADTAR